MVSRLVESPIVETPRFPTSSGFPTAMDPAAMTAIAEKPTDGTHPCIVVTIWCYGGEERDHAVE